MECDNENVFCTATKTEDGFAVLLTYSDELLTDSLPPVTESMPFGEDISGKKVTVWCIDRETTKSLPSLRKNGHR